MTDVIKTERLVLRRFRRGDAGDVVALANDLEVARWLSEMPHPYTHDHAVAFLENFACATPTCFAMTKDYELIGCILTDRHLGYWIGRPFWGQGHASEAARAMVDWHFNAGGNDLPSAYHLGNDRSGAVLTKLGFRPTDQRRITVVSTGTDVTVQDMMLSRDDWEALQ
ncbi:GNAT family N-acetyltransferase [Ruegeria sp. 2205SS24-7]|uniref:GNAT family N-acetyltransferase n=1 Tax=Ruegeria discodermiae TaxID=3064389 RepID=UPI002740CB91|nr:GNAT family N-acetyltransferase [Ruegeria sp. 2205SS24-7]MDP5216196.1 GNAT family N-acetyltransferase [Ruegeria sp. 2205SS24-7]